MKPFRGLFLQLPRHSTVRIFYFLGGIVFGTASGSYLWSLYDQLTAAFTQQNQFVPTRIYSDVYRIASPQTQKGITDRLKTLNYSYKISKNTLHFTLHNVDYPSFLLPDNHPQQTHRNGEVWLKFSESETEPKTLQSIELGQASRKQEINDLYLEPELVATLSRNGDSKREIRTALKFNEIPSKVWKAIIAVEDQHYLEHNGLDPRGIARALWVNFKTLSLAQGGSTITQQLVKNLMARRTKNIFRKMNELFLTLLLEARFEKEQILERYLNEVYLGQVGSLEVHGVAEGAEHFFGKKLDDLNLAEIALMAGIIRGPGYYSPYRYKERSLERQRLVLRKMVETGQIAQAEADTALHQPIQLTPPQTSSNKAPYFTDYVKAELLQRLKDKFTEMEMTQAGFKVYTTLDTRLNTLAQNAVTEGITSLETKLKISSQERLEGALATVDQSTGYIRALIGGKNYSISNFNRILNMKRQVGSTFKPLIYLAALLKEGDTHHVPFGPAYPMEDAPWTLAYDHNKQNWTPKNYESGFRGWVSLRTALAQSINIVAAKLGMEVGLESVINLSRTLGIESPLPQLPSLTLGIAELSPIELLRVYSTLAHQGIREDLTVIRGVTQSDGTHPIRFASHSTPVVSPAYVDLLTDMLQSVFEEGTASMAKKMGFDRPAAGKTGTTSNHRDAWFAGYTPQLTTVVWVGMDQFSQLQSAKINLTGAGSALPIWVSFMRRALQDQPIVPFPPSPYLTSVAIDRHTGLEAQSGCPPTQVVQEKYISEKVPHEKSCNPSWPSAKTP